MNLHQIEFEDTNRFSSLFLDYLQNKKELQPFFTYLPQLDQFEEIIANRGFQDHRRDILVKVLKEQYEGQSISEAVASNIDLLNENEAFTVTTGHQLNIFTGPLFFIYKVVTAINMAKMLGEHFPKNKFVPVYWMASEDHDFAEINNFRLFGKKYEWQSDQKGPVGRMNTSSMKELLDELPEKPSFCDDAYLGSKDLAAATRYIANHLFGNHGLVVLDADNKDLKKEFIPAIKDDLFNNQPFQLANQSTTQLEALGYKKQIHPREINFFYMEDGIRERFEYADGTFKVLNTDLKFSKEEMEKLIETHPEKFSPNVVMRPVYQETILPNLAYIGGPAEVAYWLQLKEVFDHFQIPFPAVFPRLFAMIVNKAVNKKINKLQLNAEDLFQEFDLLKKQLIYSNGDPQHSLDEELLGIEKSFDLIKEKAELIDKSLSGFVMSEFKKVEKGVINIQKRLKKAEEAKEEVKINQLNSVLEKLFPNGGPQEREDNFLNFYLNNPEFINRLIEILDPFVLKYNILTEDA